MCVHVCVNITPIPLSVQTVCLNRPCRAVCIAKSIVCSVFVDLGGVAGGVFWGWIAFEVCMLACSGGILLWF